MANSDRKTIDKVFVLLGLVMTAVLLVIGGLALYAADFAKTSVKDELTAQKIYFPPAGSPALEPEKYPGLQQYAGQIVDDGPKAKAYANEFIGAHLKDIAQGKTYSEVSTLAREDPTNLVLQNQKAALFQGETLRGLLLGDGYAYWTFGAISYYVAVAAFAGALLMVILVILGLRNIRKLK